MTPREVIARAAWAHYGGSKQPWRKQQPRVQQYWLGMADAVIDALEGMEVTEAMEDAWRRHDWTALPCPQGVESPWRAMVGAMRDE